MAQSLLERCQYPAALPVSSMAEQIVETIRSHQVTVVAGHTGSGKTTQLPKMCLQAGFGARAQIAHTQPRRLAAVSVAQRIAEELDSELGQDVGYQIRFDRKLSADCRIKLLTDGVLLNEIQFDRQLKAYDCIIVDEAHERSLNIDFTLGYLKRLLKRRRDLHLVITSATIDTERFAGFFDQAPVINIPGKTFPVETLYRPLGEEQSLNEALAAAVAELEAQPKNNAGVVLCFLSTEQEIHEAAQYLRGRLSEAYEILPLFARLPAKQQARVFTAPPPGRRRLILATNIAETSVTVPGVSSVIDSGFCRLSRYSYRSKIQQLPIEAISQASAGQRQGRCGRLGPGVCLRLYSEEDFAQRPEFTEAEILRTNLAAVILKLYSLGIRSIDDFDFLDAPDGRLIRDGIRLLLELQAIKAHGEDTYTLTKIGKTLARLPLEPRLGRILIESARRHCLHEALIICAALSVPDPRERPAGKQPEADAAHRKFSDPRSDFIRMLKLWRAVQGWRGSLNAAQYRKRLRQEFLSWPRLNDWRDVHDQLRSLAADVGLRSRPPSEKGKSKPATYEAIHRTLLSGLPTQIGLLGERGEYQGPRQRRFRLFPGSGVARKPPPCVVAAELLETRAVYAHGVASVKTAWVLAAATHMLQRSIEQPFYDSRSGRVKAHESASLQGLALSSRRVVELARHDPVLARRVFIEQALIAGQWRSDLPCFVHNRKSIAAASRIAAKLRRADLLCIEEALAELYEARLPQTVNSSRGFEQWYSGLAEDQRASLQLPSSDLMLEQPDPAQLDAFPDRICREGREFAVNYCYLPGDESDGVEITVPEFILPVLATHSFDDLVPGLFEPKCIALLKSLPKALRKPIVPVADTVTKHQQELTEGSGPLLHRLARILQQYYGVQPEADDWDLSRVPDYYFARVIVKDDQGRVVQSRRWGREETVPAENGSGSRRSRPNFTAAKFDQANIQAASYPDLPEVYEHEHNGLRYQTFPGLRIQGSMVQACLYYQRDVAVRDSGWALALLYQNSSAERARYWRSKLFAGNEEKLALAVFPHRDTFFHDCLQRLFFEAFACEQGVARTARQFRERLSEAGSRLEKAATRWLPVYKALLAAHYSIVQARENVSSSHFQSALEDVNRQLKGLLCKGFLSTVSAESLQHYPRYLQATAQRVQRLREQQGRDERNRLKLARWEQQLTAEIQPGSDQPGSEQMAHLQHAFYWLLQEYRVSLFAQGLGTAVPVSETRVRQAWDGRFDNR